MADLHPLTWLVGADEIDWPTTQLVDPELGVAAIAVPDHWRDADRSVPGTVRWLGAFPGEGLVISWLDHADPGADLETWVEAEVALSGGCSPFLRPSGVDAHVIEWLGTPDDPAVNGRFDVDESRSFVGLVRLDLERPELLRTYSLLLRRDHRAWKFTLQLSTACPPGIDDAMIDANDHARARAIFGTLALADLPDPE